MQPGQKANIFLPDGKVIPAALETIKGHALGGKSWLGWAGDGANRGRIVMTEVNGFTFAAITYGHALYLIEPAQNAAGYILYSTSAPGLKEVDLVNDSLIPPMSAIAASAAPKGKGLSRPAASGSAGTVDVGIFYHSSMRDRWGLGLSARLQFLIQLYDTAMTDSVTGIRANLVHISEVSGTQTKSNGDTLTDLKDGTSNADGDFAGIAAIRAAKGIDIVTYIRQFKESTHTSCGTGFVLGTGGGSTIGASSSPFGFNTVSDNIDVDAPPSGSFSLCSVFTLAHEIGHNMGNTHDIATSPEDGVFSYSHGYLVGSDFKTIMATGGNTRLGFYSNPSLTKCTDPGSSGQGSTPCGTAGADVARSMREQGKNVGTFNTPAARLVSSVLPVSRSIKSDATATAFATVINPAGTGTATGCKLGIPGATASQFSYTATSPAAPADTPVSIPGGGVQNFTFAITPGAVYAGFVPTQSSDTFTGADLAIEFSCDNRQSAESIPGLNTLSFVAESGAVMDVIALAAAAIPGIVETGGGTGAFSVSVSNIGAAGTVTVTGEPSSGVTATVTVCETDPVTAACLASPSASISKTLAKDETATFSYFVTETGTIIADFAQKRIFARFKEGSTLRGATSVAVRSAP
jgi:Metallo-peptidase family M12B Reprolysin-like